MRHSVITVLGCVAALATCAVFPTLAGASPLEAQGDFDGNGVVDRAVLDHRTVDVVLVIDLGEGQFKRKSLLRLNIDKASLTTAARGETYSAACLRGAGKDCKVSADTQVVLENDGVLVHQSESSSILFYLKGGALKSLTISD